MKKKVIILIIVLGVIVGGIVFFVWSFKKDQNETLKKMEDINSSYEEFYQEVLEINDIREEFSSLISNIYYESLNDKNAEILVVLENYGDSIKNMKKVSSKLEGLCQNYYSDSSVNQKCESYKNTFESANNYFVSDIEGYNSIVRKYNDSVKDSKIEEFVIE